MSMLKSQGKDGPQMDQEYYTLNYCLNMYRPKETA